MQENKSFYVWLGRLLGLGTPSPVGQSVPKNENLLDKAESVRLKSTKVGSKGPVLLK